jgi:DNA gyrase subunit A
MQAQAILDMQLRRLAALERQKIEDEHRQVSEQISYLEALLADPHKTLDVIRGELVEMADKYGDERRTRIAAEARQDFSEEDLIENVPVLVSITQRGYIKRVASQAFRTQTPGGRGVQGQATREEDEVVYFFPACTLDTILFFSNKGKVYSTKAYQIPDANRTGRGVSVRSVLNFNDEETVTAAVAVPDFKAANYCTMVTRNGRSKRVVLSEFESIRQSGVIAITLDKDDELHWVRLTKGDDDVILVSEQGQAVRFNEQEVRAMGRVAAGVSAIKLRKGDHLASMEVVEPGGDLLIVTARGYGKRTPLSEYTAKSRATGGVATINREAISKIGKITAARVVQEADDLTIISTNGIVLRTNVADISRQGRATRGVVLMHLQEGDSIASLARIAKANLEETGLSNGGNLV